MSHAAVMANPLPSTGFSNSAEHEIRLQELWRLSQRQQETDPGPGHYQAVPASAFRLRSPHRPHQQPLDGPFPLQSGQDSSRAHALDTFLLLPDSGLGPAAYNQGSSKDALGHRAAAVKIGTARRVSSAVAPSQVCLSLSRSLGAGLDWRQQLTHAQVQQHLTATAAAATTAAPGWAAGLTGTAGTVAASCRVGSAQPAAAAGQCTHGDGCTTAAEAPQHPGDCVTLEQQAGKEDEQQLEAGQLVWNTLQQQQQPQQQECWLQAAPRPRPATTGSRTRSAEQCMPWQLAASIQHHKHVLEAMQAQADLQQQQQQQHLRQQPPLKQHTGSTSVPRPVVVVLRQREVLQHQSAARAVSAVQQLAGRRQQWELLSGVPPPPYPVSLPDAPAAGAAKP